MTSIRKIRVCEENVVWVVNENYLAVYVEENYIQIFIFSEGRSMTVNFSSAFQAGQLDLCRMVLLQCSTFSVAL